MADGGSSYDAVPVIEAALAGDTVLVNSIRLSPSTDEQRALDIVAALERAGFRIVPS